MEELFVGNMNKISNASIVGKLNTQRNIAYDIKETRHEKTMVNMHMKYSRVNQCDEHDDKI
jgi:hypothetical protein